MKRINGSMMAWTWAADFVHGLLIGAMAVLLLSAPTSDPVLCDQAAIVKSVERRLESEWRVRERAALERGRIESLEQIERQIWSERELWTRRILDGARSRPLERCAEVGDEQLRRRLGGIAPSRPGRDWLVRDETMRARARVYGVHGAPFRLCLTLEEYLIVRDADTRFVNGYQFLAQMADYPVGLRYRTGPWDDRTYRTGASLGYLPIATILRYVD